MADFMVLVPSLILIITQILSIIASSIFQSAIGPNSKDNLTVVQKMDLEQYTLAKVKSFPVVLSAILLRVTAVSTKRPDN